MGKIAKLLAKLNLWPSVLITNMIKYVIFAFNMKITLTNMEKNPQILMTQKPSILKKAKLSVAFSTSSIAWGEISFLWASSQQNN